MNIARIIPHLLSPTVATVLSLYYISLSERDLGMFLPLDSLLLHKKPPRSRSSNVLCRGDSLHDLYVTCGAEVLTE